MIDNIIHPTVVNFAVPITLGEEVTPSALKTRKIRIEMLLAGAAMPVLDHAEHLHEWIDINDALAPVYAQLDVKPKGGRPHSGAAEAARKLPFPKYMSDSAKRQRVQRDLRISGIFPRAKEEARTQKLDDNQTALLAIAAEDSEEAQVEVARNWRFRNLQAPPAPGDFESYQITGLEGLSAKEHQRLDRVMRAIQKRLGVSVVHVGRADRAPDPKEPGSSSCCTKTTAVTTNQREN